MSLELEEVNKDRNEINEQFEKYKGKQDAMMKNLMDNN